MDYLPLIRYNWCSADTVKTEQHFPDIRDDIEYVDLVDLTLWFVTSGGLMGYFDVFGELQEPCFVGLGREVRNVENDNQNKYNCNEICKQKQVNM
jgi:hypothetical protein